MLTNRCTHGGDVITLQVEDDVIQSVDSFLWGEIHFVVFAASVGCYLQKNNNIQNRQI